MDTGGGLKTRDNYFLMVVVTRCKEMNPREKKNRKTAGKSRAEEEEGESPTKG